MSFRIDRIADLLHGGGVIAYPTEGVFGLGCLPDDKQAILRLLRIKERDPAMGLILIASRPDQLEGWVESCSDIPEPEAEKPITWIAPKGPLAHPLVTGLHDGIAVRLCTNPIAASLCDAVDMPLVSTSANISGRPVARNQYVLHRIFRNTADAIVGGRCGPASGPSEIRVLASDRVVRKGS